MSDLKQTPTTEQQDTIKYVKNNGGPILGYSTASGVEDVAHDMACHVDSENHVYDFAFGMNWSGVIEDMRTAKYKKVK